MGGKSLEDKYIYKIRLSPATPKCSIINQAAQMIGHSRQAKSSHELKTSRTPLRMNSVFAYAHYQGEGGDDVWTAASSPGGPDSKMYVILPK